ncbi:MAG: Arginine repressor [Pelotomaculum sp. PtaB.Bin013]|uniref:Arginine repressor n=1 Tax=Pelotomaculum isophthalicicum JI TaxID=947010 RepID=A0A9X4JTH8_9FIRM|nr:arginine repressor [Pelotomaculum isophthalicicum]MDF9407465.1 arginine repressor [Pelotomaculum isophthalicicum JI]OPX92007.1 MAG: Arginine repressor [Pelotomaculum sp. PtaB.Bin013]
MKARRQHKILELIQQEIIETQEELAVNLRKCGFEVTQATVSRDIKELGLIKIPCENNHFKYAYPGEQTTQSTKDRLKRYFRDSVVSLAISENLLVIKTHPGEAQGVASAIDKIGWREIIGTVGGDDTILVVVKPKQVAETVMRRFEDLHRG